MLCHIIGMVSKQLQEIFQVYFLVIDVIKVKQIKSVAIMGKYIDITWNALFQYKTFALDDYYSVHLLQGK